MSVLLRVEIGNPMSGVKVTFDVDENGTKKELETQTFSACDALQTASEAWRTWSLKNETPQQKKIREVGEERQQLELAIAEQQNKNIRAQLQ